MDIEELWIDIDMKKIWSRAPDEPHPPSTSPHSWRQFFRMLPNVKKLVVVARDTPDLHPPILEYLEALCNTDGSSPALLSLTELHLIFSGGFVLDSLSILQRVKADRKAVGYPIDKLVVGAQPPLVLYEKTISDICEKLGPEVICDSQDVSFDWSPFSERIPYSKYHWPEHLFGDAPGLWTDHPSYFEN